MKLARIAFLSLLACAGTVANAGLLYDRGLPEKNLNNAAGSDRSNVAWAEDASVGILGDDFTLAGTGLYKVDSVRIWVIKEEDAVFGGQPMQLSIWRASEGIDGFATGNYSGDFTATPTLYSDGQTYQGSSGRMLKLWQVDFKFFDFYVQGGDKQLFFLGGIYNGITPYMHASNSLLSGSTMEGADDSMYELLYSDPSSGEPSIVSWTSKGNGWDKASDFNIQIMGERAVPGPAAVLPFAVGLLAAAKRRRK